MTPRENASRASSEPIVRFSRPSSATIFLATATICPRRSSRRVSGPGMGAFRGNRTAIRKRQWGRCRARVTGAQSGVAIHISPMPGTKKLYHDHDDASLAAFDACVVAHGHFGDAVSVILDRTAFYPESGGQMADRGALAGAPI